MKRPMIKACLFLALTLGAAPSHASLILTLQRVSDTQGILTGTGTADFGGVYLGLQSAATVGDTGTEAVGGDMTIGGTPVSTSFVVFGETLFLFRTSDFSVTAGDAIAGTAIFNLDAEIWAAIGTVGTVSVYSSDSSAGFVDDTGRYSIVPEPTTLGLLLAGLIGLVWRRRSA